MKKRSLNRLQERQKEQRHRMGGGGDDAANYRLSGDTLGGPDQLPKNGHPGAFSALLVSTQ